MKVIVVGLGSMGRRRIRLLRQIDKDIRITGVDMQPERRKQAEEMFHIDTADDLEHSLTADDIDCAFVCTSPLTHAEIINKCLSTGLHVFSEINLVDDGYEENIALAEEKGRVLFLSSTPMYRKEIKFITGAVSKQKLPVTYRYHVGQYLPDWHPWESFKDFFVSDKRTNGCRELLAIELPWITDVFGSVSDCKVQKARNTSLNISYPDTYQILLKHESGHMGMIQADIVSRKAVRNLVVTGENTHIEWNGTPDSLYEYDIPKKKDVKISLYPEVDKLNDYSENIIEDAYKEEILNFFDCISYKCEAKWSFEKDRDILNIIDKIEEYRL